VATGASEFVDKTISDGVFSPDKWAKEVLRATEANLVFAKNVNRAFEDDAQVGRTVKVASIGNLAARAKSENTAITYETVAETATTITLNIWDYAAVGVEDIIKVQSQVDVQNEYQRKIGYAIAKDIDTALAAAPSGFSQNLGTLGTLFTDDQVRRAVQYLDDADAPEDERVLIMSPAEKNDKLALDRWSNALYRGGTAGQQVSRGQIGSEIYGLTPFVTTNTKAQAGGQADNTVMHREAYALVIQREPRMHMFYDIDFFSWKIAAEVIFGHAEMRDTFGVYLKGQR
jgi:hypothetical protein